MKSIVYDSARKIKLIIINYPDYWRLLIIGSLSAFVLLWGLGQGSLMDWDEAIYAQVSKEIVNNGNWLVLHYGYKPWFEKPPLFMWTTALFYRIFGINEFWARAGSAFSGILLIIVTYFVGKLSYDRWVGTLAALTLLSSYEFIRISRFGTTDVMLTLFIFVAIYAYLRLRDSSSKWWYLFWVSFAFAFMVKSMAAVIVLPAISLALLFERRMTITIHSKNFWLGIFMAFAIITPWHLLMYFKFGKQFIDTYFIYHLYTRTIRAVESHVGGPLYYVNALQRLFLPWFYLTLFAIALCIRENIRAKSRSLILLLLIGAIVGTYTFIVNTKLTWYILPVYPIFAILIGSMIVQAQKSYQSIAFAGLLSSVLLSVLIAQTKLLYFATFMGLLIVIAKKLRLVSEQRANQIVVFGIFVLMALISFGSAIRLYGLDESPAAAIGKIIHNSTSDHREPLIVLYLPEDIGTIYRVMGPTTQFYSNRSIRMARDMEKLVKLTNDGEVKEIVFAEKYVKNLSEDYDIKILATVNSLVYAKIKVHNNP